MPSSVYSLSVCISSVDERSRNRVFWLGSGIPLGRGGSKKGATCPDGSSRPAFDALSLVTGDARAVLRRPLLGKRLDAPRTRVRPATAPRIDLGRRPAGRARPAATAPAASNAASRAGSVRDGPEPRSASPAAVARVFQPFITAADWVHSHGVLTLRQSIRRGRSTWCFN